MKNLITFIAVISSIVILNSGADSQTIVASYPFPNYSQYNSFWGITKIGNDLRIATDNNGSIYTVSTAGLITDSLTIPYAFNHGLVWDGTGYWIAEQFRTAGARLFKVSASGVALDTIQLPSLIGGASGGVGGLALDGDGIWFSIYSPDFTSYPFAYAYKINLNSRLITDTIPLRGRQVQGITVKGDTIFYVNDYFHTTPGPDPERIYAYSKTTGDTLFSFATPDPDGDCSPKGLHWDGEYLWLIADRIGNNVNLYKTLYKYSITGQGNPQITTSSNNLDFGNTIIGNISDRNLTITNSGTARLIISNFTMTNPRFEISPNLVPDTLNPNQAKNFTLKFIPTVYDTTSGQLRISTNDAVTPVKIVNLYGKGVHNGSYITSSVSSINFNARRINSLCGGYINILNKGTTPLNITGITTNTQRFRLDTTSVTYPITIDSQKTKLLRIWFNPNAATSFTDTVTINSNAVNNASYKIFVTGTGANNLTTLGEIFWQGNIPDNPNTVADNFKVMSMKEIPDVNYDGKNDVMVATDNYWTICYNGNSSVTDDTLWKFNTRQSSQVSGSVVYEDGMQIMDDINGDGIKDVVIGTGGNNELIYALSGRTGELLWTYGDSTITSDGDINGLSVTKDYNGDGRKDILAAATGEGKGDGRHSAICLNAVNGGVIFISTQNSEFTHSITSTSTGGAIDFSSNGGPYGINGFNISGGLTWTFPTASTVWNLKELQDLNNDGNTDIASFIGFNGTVSVLSGNNGLLLWSQNYGTSIDGNIRIMDDISGDGFMDLVFSGPRTLFRIDSRTGNSFWTQTLDGNYIHSVDYITDVNGNGIHEIVAGTQNSNLYVVSGDSGRVLFNYNFGSATANTVEQVAGIKSIDGNTSSEFLGGSRTGKLICFSGGPNGTVGVQNISSNVPDKYSLSQNYPNPFNPTTNLEFGIPELGNVSLKIYDGLGREIQTLVNGKFSPGNYKIDFDGSNLASGVYFYKLESGNFIETKRMMLLK